MAAELRIGIGADNSELNRSLQDAEKRISAFVDKVGQIGALGEKLSSMGQRMTVGLTLPILALGGSAIKAYGDIQALQKGLEAVMGSAGSASKEFERLKEVSRLPGLGMQEAVKGSINLQAIGISADKSRNILSQFGNAVATVGKGRVEFERAIYGVQQLANTDFPLGEDLNIIKDALPQVSNLLKDAFGSSRSDELAKMGVSSKQVLDTILVGLEGLPRVTGGINGAFENLGDSMKTSLGRIGKIIDDNFDISGIIDKITGFVDKAVSAFESLSPSIQNTILVVAGLAAAAGPLLVAVGGLLAMLPTLLSGLGAVKVAFAALTGPIGLVTLAIVGVVTAVVANWGKIKPYIINTINYFRELYNESIIVRAGVTAIALTFKNVFTVVSNVLKTAWEIFKSFAKGVADLFGGIGTVISGALTGDFGEIKNGVSKIGTAILGGIANVANDSKAGINNLFSDLKDNFNYGLSSIVNNQQLKPITDLKIFDEEKIAEKTEQNITKGVEKGVKKAKEKTVKIELPDIEPLDMGKTSGFINNLGEQFDTLLQFAVRTDEISNMINNSVAKIDFTPIGENIKTATDIAAENAERMKLAGEEFVNSVNSMISDGFVEGISQAFEAMGGAMLNGGNILAAAGGAILGVLGSFMQMLGKEMIKLAVATIALGNLVSGIKKWIIANPGAAIALAGVAIVAGALLSAAGSSIGGGSGGGGSSSGYAGGGSQSYSSSYSSGGGFGNGGEVVFRISGNDLVGVLSRQQDKNTRLGG